MPIWAVVNVNERAFVVRCHGLLSCCNTGQFKIYLNWGATIQAVVSVIWELFHPFTPTYVVLTIIC